VQNYRDDRNDRLYSSNFRVITTDGGSFSKKAAGSFPSSDTTRDITSYFTYKSHRTYPDVSPYNIGIFSLPLYAAMIPPVHTNKHVRYSLERFCLSIPRYVRKVYDIKFNGLDKKLQLAAYVSHSYCTVALNNFKQL